MGSGAYGIVWPIAKVYCDYPYLYPYMIQILHDHPPPIVDQSLPIVGHSIYIVSYIIITSYSLQIQCHWGFERVEVLGLCGDQLVDG